MLWFTSDNHFFHTNIIKYSNRPYKDVEEMNWKMREAWNNVVQPRDTVWLLGDVGFAKPELLVPYLQSLNGDKHVVWGNHDKSLQQVASKLLADGTLKSVQDYKELRYGGEFIVLSHYAKRTWNKAHHGSIHLFGHTHGSLPPLGKSVDVGVDDKNITNEYRPVSIDEVLRFMSKRESHTGHHDGRG